MSLGHQNTIGSVWREANPILSAASNSKGACQFYAISITSLFTEMDHLEAIGSTVSEQLWGISKSLAV
jgi:hypothetical protein